MDSASATTDSNVAQTVNNEPRRAKRPPVLLQSQLTPVPSPANPGPRESSQDMAFLREFLRTIDGYTPIAGLPPAPQTDQRIARLLAFATQKFVADVAADAFLHSRFRSAGNARQLHELIWDRRRAGRSRTSGGIQNKAVLTMEDVGVAVREYGVNVKRGDFYR
ncbi:reverse transcriptase [Purpureocillium lavendulum]|uniref:Reverse transcriptase n=1 Tax=Purpureocillium lavendulum TaxID=1247861 RepID=A0AB34FCU0_9HYPO|nr:reverse transcriptase [Purpureocillium lavendulum]